MTFFKKKIGLLYLFYIMFHIHTQSLRLKLFSNRSLLGWQAEINFGNSVIKTALAVLCVILLRVNAISGNVNFSLF